MTTRRKAIFYSRFNPSRLLCLQCWHDRVIVPPEWSPTGDRVGRMCVRQPFCQHWRPL